MSEISITNDYIITNHSASISQNTVRDPGNDTADAAATTIYQVDQQIASMVDGKTVVFTDAAGVAKTYIFDDDGDGATGTIDGSGRVRVQITSGGDAAAAELKTAIEHSNGHNGSIVVTDLGGSTPQTFRVQQSSAGPSGNTSVTGTAIDDFIMTVQNSSKFAGGTTGAAAYKATDVLPYKFSIKGPFNIRGQTTESRYRVFLG